MWVLDQPLRRPPRRAARTDAGHRFILYTAVGSTLMLVGILALVTSAGTSDLPALAAGAGAALPADRQLLVAVLLVARARRQGARLPAAHLAPAGAHHRADRRVGAARGRAAQDGHLRPGAAAGRERPRRLRAARPGARRSPVSSASSGVRWSASSSATSSGSSPTRRWRTWASSSSPSPPGPRPACRRRCSPTSRTASSRPCCSSSSAASSSAGAASTSPWPGRRCARPHRGSASCSSSGSPRASGCPASPGSGASSSPCTPRGCPPPTGPAGCSSRAPWSPPSAPPSPPAYALRVARTVWVGDRPDPEAAAATPDTRGVELVVLGVLGALVVVLGVLPGPLLGGHRRRRRPDRRGAAVIAADARRPLDAVVLAPALLPALGVVLVLVGDAVLPGRRALAAAARGRRAPRRAPARRWPPACARPTDPVRTLCLPGPRRRLPVDRGPGDRHAPGRHPAGHRGGARACCTTEAAARATPP